MSHPYRTPARRRAASLEDDAPVAGLLTWVCYAAGQVIHPWMTYAGVALSVAIIAGRREIARSRQNEERKP